MGVGVGTSIGSGVGVGADITDYGAGSGVMRRGSMATDIDTTAADGTISMCCSGHPKHDDNIIHPRFN